MAAAVQIVDECRSCAHFQNDPQEIERQLRGLTSMSSGYGSVRADDGLCLRHDWLCRASAVCPDFKAADP